MIYTLDTHVKMIREVNADCVGDEGPTGEPPSVAGRKGGVAVDLEAKAAAEEAAVSSFSSSLSLAGTGDGRRPATVGE